ncbi:hypothetical protein F4556_004068 [Kitasatospora gansuensis]|uniref:Uncharacterized protein n=1 Tax=Kitasatospora gansuensis TaxID=258050 RepID=A0A7W7SEQ7_9ACTN|nr:hypothetical protein [Kitasatospora gansuensis]MBB4948533.1 hypothetical protein [Kitasatospora gansuensis]
MAVLPENIVDRLRDMQRKIQQVAVEARNRPALTRILGDLTVSGGGRLTVRAPDDKTLLRIGDITAPNAAPQQGMLTYRDDGTLAFSISGSGSDRQWVGIWDRFEHLVVSDDTLTGGLARPYIPIPLYPAPTPITSSGWTRVLQAGMFLQHPKIAVGVWVSAAAATTVEARVMYLNSSGVSVQLGSSVTANGTATTQQVIDFHGQTPFTWSNLYIEARRTVGTGAASAGVLFAEGRQT